MNPDPFASIDVDDRTVLRPRSRRQVEPAEADSHGRPDTLPRLGGINRLEKAASRLLPLLISLRHTSSNPDPQRLRNDLIRELEEFKQLAARILTDSRQVTQASYVMCTALDEAVMKTPWGHAGDWSQHSLLATFHNEVVGGERFFALLKRLSRQPRENLDILELMYVCLSLGYEGSYRVARNGQETLVRIRRWLHELIGSVRPREASALSVHWQGSGIGERSLPRITPVWVFCAVALGLAAVCIFAYRLSLGAHLERTAAGFWQASVEPVRLRAVLPPVVPRMSTAEAEPLPVTLSEHLLDEIDAGRLAVDEVYDQSRVRIVGDSLFGSGQVALDPAVLPLLQRIGTALDHYQGNVLVTGHSDNVPVVTGRFASNLELSQARADAVAAALVQHIAQPQRLQVEGRGSLEPVADNTSAAGRAANRRVEITLYY